MGAAEAAASVAVLFAALGLCLVVCPGSGAIDLRPAASGAELGARKVERPREDGASLDGQGQNEASFCEGV